MSAIFFQSACFLVKREKLIELHGMLNDLFEQELTRDRESEATMLATMHTFDRPFYMMVFILASTVMLILVPPMISAVRLTIRHANPKEYRLPFPAKFLWPTPIGGSLSFYLHLLYQISISWWLIFTIGSVDSLFGYYAFQISSILQSMSTRLANLRTRETFMKVLGECAYTHHKLMRCGHILSDIWGLIIVRMLFTNAILMCTLIFELTPVCLELDCRLPGSLTQFLFRTDFESVMSATNSIDRIPDRSAIEPINGIEWQIDCTN